MSNPHAIGINTAAFICQTFKDGSTKSPKPKVEFGASHRRIRRGKLMDTSARNRQKRNTRDESDMCIKVEWEMFPQAPTLLQEPFSCFESEEMFFAGLGEMALSHRRESILKIFSDDDICDKHEASAYIVNCAGKSSSDAPDAPEAPSITQGFQVLSEMR